MDYNKSIPNDKDWIDCPTELDGPYARKRFFGLTRTQATKLFIEGPSSVISLAHEIYIVPPVPFRYYWLSFKDYVVTKEAQSGDSDAASCFMSMTLTKLEEEHHIIKPIMEELLVAAHFIATHQLRYHADYDIYGNFHRMYNRMVKLNK